MVTIKESGLTFGPFSEDQIYQIEKAKAYTGLGAGVKAVEFVYKKFDDKLYFIEAKSSSPMPGKDEFKRFVEDISDKFVHSFNIWITLKIGRRTDDISTKILNADIKKQVFRFILVINGHNKAWLHPIKAAIERKMMADIEIWKHEIAVLNEEMAVQKGFVGAE